MCVCVWGGGGGGECPEPPLDLLLPLNSQPTFFFQTTAHGLVLSTTYLHPRPLLTYSVGWGAELRRIVMIFLLSPQCQGSATNLRHPFRGRSKGLGNYHQFVPYRMGIMPARALRLKSRWPRYSRRWFANDWCISVIKIVTSLWDETS